MDKQKLEIAKQTLEKFKARKQSTTETNPKSHSPIDSLLINTVNVKSPPNNQINTDRINPQPLPNREQEELNQEIIKLRNKVQILENQNAQLQNQLKQEQRITVLLQAEVEALPDLIQKFHQERSKLLQRVNRSSAANLGTNLGIKSTNDYNNQETSRIKGNVDSSTITSTSTIKCGFCKPDLFKL